MPSLRSIKKKINNNRLEGNKNNTTNGVPPVKHDENNIFRMYENFNKNLTAFVKAACEMGIANIVKEFQELQVYEKKHLRSHKEFDANLSKCRYRDILCYDDSRFVLQCKSNDSKEEDFIHANHMDSSNNPYYICTQAPLPNTINDFWRMVWQSKTRSIVMLCEVIECGKKKSEQYWPLNSNEDMKSGDIIIKFLDKHDIERNVVRSFLVLIKDKKRRLVSHYQYLGWPDRGVPNNYLMCLRLMKKATKCLPVIVHCSAGIGRTGTIICLDDMITKLSRPEGCLRMKNALLEKRRFRYGIVQTEAQYLFIHRVLISLAIQKKLVNVDEVSRFIQQYDIVISKLCDQPNKRVEQKVQQKVETKVEYKPMQKTPQNLEPKLDATDETDNQHKENAKQETSPVHLNPPKNRKNKGSKITTDTESDRSPGGKSDSRERTGFSLLRL